MLIIAFIFLLISTITTHATNFDFNQRFGPDSHIYNTPLYFKKKCVSKSKKCYGIQYRKDTKERKH